MDWHYIAPIAVSLIMGLWMGFRHLGRWRREPSGRHTSGPGEMVVLNEKEFDELVDQRKRRRR